MKNVLVDFRISETEEENLNKLGFEVLKVPYSPILYSAVCGHPDILLHPLDNNRIIVHKHMPKDFINYLESLGYTVLLSQNSLDSSYPFDIMLNAVNMSDIFLHNLKYTDPVLKNTINNKKLLDVKQGYSKCSTAVISKNAAITSDMGIYNSLTSVGKDVLLIPPKHIELPGLDYGFIGGSCGLLDDGTIAFYGSLEKYEYGKMVMNFLIKHDVKPVYLRDDILIDRGTLFCM